MKEPGDLWEEILLLKGWNAFWIEISNLKNLGRKRKINKVFPEFPHKFTPVPGVHKALNPIVTLSGHSGLALCYMQHRKNLSNFIMSMYDSVILYT
jgi:hypothetical protein